jgi:hypothetical protein
VSAVAHERSARGSCGTNVAPDEDRSKAHCDVDPLGRLEGLGVGGDDGDAVLQTGGGHPPPSLVSEGRTDLDAIDAAAELPSQDDRRPRHTTGHVEDVARRVEAQVLADPPDLVRADGVLDDVVALGDLVGPAHDELLAHSGRRVRGAGATGSLPATGQSAC